MSELPLYLLVIVVGYLLGSIPSGQIVGALSGGVDLSKYGSGKTGMTNALRTLGWGAAVAVLIGDLAKGIVAVLLARALLDGPGSNHLGEVLAGFAAVVGHNWSIYIGMKGGRGVVVSFAVFALLCPPAALISMVVSIGILVVSHYVSLASLLGSLIGFVLMVVFVTWQHYPQAYLIYGLLAAPLIWLRHVDNIERLRQGTERKLGQKAQPIH